MLCDEYVASLYFALSLEYVVDGDTRVVDVGLVPTPPLKVEDTVTGLMANALILDIPSTSESPMLFLKRSHDHGP